jgi:hypothetical protein
MVEVLMLIALMGIAYVCMPVALSLTIRQRVSASASSARPIFNICSGKLFLLNLG